MLQGSREPLAQPDCCGVRERARTLLVRGRVLRYQCELADSIPHHSTLFYGFSISKEEGEDGGGGGEPEEEGGRRRAGREEERGRRS